MAWRIPPVWKSLLEDNLTIPENSKTILKQRSLKKAAEDALREIAQDVRGGLLETVGVNSAFSIDDEGRCSMILELPEETDAQHIAHAIDLENIEAWHDAQNRVCVGISPWYSTKDVDQAVLCTIKVIHVLLGLHAADNTEPRSFSQKLLVSLMDVMKAQKKQQ